jgi:hypothetical protein
MATLLIDQLAKGSKLRPLLPPSRDRRWDWCFANAPCLCYAIWGTFQKWAGQQSLVIWHLMGCWQNGWCTPCQRRPRSDALRYPAATLLTAKTPIRIRLGKKIFMLACQEDLHFSLAGTSYGAGPGQKDGDMPMGCSRPCCCPELTKTPKCPQDSSGYGQGWGLHKNCMWAA